MRRNILWFLFIACLLGALLSVTFGVLRVIEARSSTSWPTVTGIILESSFRRSGTENRRELRVRYSYTVDGTAYENERIAFGGKPASESNEVTNALLRSCRSGCARRGQPRLSTMIPTIPKMPCWFPEVGFSSFTICSPQFFYWQSAAPSIGG